MLVQKPPPQEPRLLLTVTQCAAHHEVSRTAIHSAIREGRLAARKAGNIWLVTEADCQSYQPLRTAAERAKRNRELPKGYWKKRWRQRQENFNEPVRS